MLSILYKVYFALQHIQSATNNIARAPGFCIWHSHPGEIAESVVGMVSLAIITLSSEATAPPGKQMV